MPATWPSSPGMRTLIAPLFLLGALSACGRRGLPVPEVHPFASPAPSGSAEVNLSSAGDRLYLSWIVASGAGGALQYAVLQGRAWSAPRTIARGDSLLASWADFPALHELAGGMLAAHWLRRHGAEEEARDVMFARSTDGAAWERGTSPHHDGTPTEHGFVSFVPDARGGATMVWLDGRDYAGKEHESGTMRLMAATLTSAGFSPEQVIDPRVCDCCQTSAVRTPSGVLVAYRDRSAQEVRDISLVRFENGSWSEPYALAADDWRIAGCPVNGPSLAADGDRVAAAWFAMSNGKPVLRVALSRDAGKTFPEQVRVDDGDPLGRADIVLLPGGGALSLWVESAADGAGVIRARRVREDGRLDPGFTVATTSAERASGFPRLERVGRRIYFAWTEPSEPSQVRMAEMDLP